MPHEGSLAWVSSDLERRIIRRLASLRAQRGWSLDDVADRVGISRATLSRIERLKLSPPTAILIQLCHAFDWSLKRIVADAERAAPTLVTRLQQRVRLHRATGARRRVVSPATDGLRGELEEVFVPVGAIVALDRRPTANLEHHLWVLGGRLDVHVDGASFQLHTEESLRWQGADRAVLRGAGQRGARVLVAIVRS